MASSFIGFWNFNKNDITSVKDFSTNARHSASVSSLTIADSDEGDGKMGQFNDISTVVKVAHIAAFDELAEWSFACRVKRTVQETTTWEPISAMQGNHYIALDPTGKLYFEDDGGFSVYGVTELDYDVWYTLVFTGDGSKLRFYIDGVLDKENDFTGILLPTSTYQLWFGADETYGDYFSGKIQSLVWWNRALNLDEITYLTSNINGTPRYLQGESDILTGDLLISGWESDAPYGTEVVTFAGATGKYYSIPISTGFKDDYAISVGHIWNIDRQKCTLQLFASVLVLEGVSKFEHLTDGTKIVFGRDGNGDVYGIELPVGGTSGQILIKQSGTDGDADWKSLSSEITIDNNGVATSAGALKNAKDLFTYLFAT